MIDFDRLVNVACIKALGVPVKITLGSGVQVSILRDGSPLLGIFEESQKELREENGIMIASARPQLGMSRMMLLDACLRPDDIGYGDTVIEVGGRSWGVMEMLPPDSQGDIQIMLKIP